MTCGIRIFCNKLPSLKDGILEFEYVYSRDGKIKYRDGVKKNNIYIKTVLPRIFYVDHERRKSSIQEDLIMLCRVERNMQTLKITCVYLISIRCVISALIA